MIKEIKDFHDFYKKTIESEEFEKYRKEREKELKGCATLGGASYPMISFFDVLSNEDVSKLLVKLHSLDKKRFNCHHRYKKPRIINNYNYIHLKNGSASYGAFDEIELLDDSFIKRIEIDWTQINNYYAFFEYRFVFSKAQKQGEILDTIDKNICSFTKKDFFLRYGMKTDSYLDFLSLDDYPFERFIELCQHFITSYLYSKTAKQCLLPFLLWTCFSNKMDLSKVATDRTGIAYYNKEQNFIIFKDIGDYGYQLLSQNGSVPRFLPTSYVMKYGLTFYYSFFGRYELDLFNCEFTDYSTNKKTIPYKKLVSLLNRAQGLREENDYRERMNHDFEEEWLYYVNGKAEKASFSTDYFAKVFDEAFSYFKVLNDFYLGRLNKWISITALFVSLAGLVAAIASVVVTAISVG